MNAVNTDNETSLHLAAQKGHVDVAKVLVENGADVNAIDGFGQTTLHLAAFYGHVDVAKVLVENGADVNAVNTDSCRKLEWVTEPLGTCKI